MTDAQQENVTEATTVTTPRSGDPRRASVRRAARPCLAPYTDPELIPQWRGPRA